MERRERTRRLIELGGLVQKAGLVELTDDDRAVLFGALLSIADQLAGPDRSRRIAAWLHLGRRAFAADARPSWGDPEQDARAAPPAGAT